MAAEQGELLSLHVFGADLIAAAAMSLAPSPMSARASISAMTAAAEHRATAATTELDDQHRAIAAAAEFVGGRLVERSSPTSTARSRRHQGG